MEQMFVKDLLDATKGTLLCGKEDLPVERICINSKEAQVGDLFVPLIGEKVDAHRFLKMALEAENMVLNAEMMLRASIARTESRGVHFREDYPCPDEENWRAWTAVSRDGETMRVEKIPVPAGMWDDI